MTLALTTFIVSFLAMATMVGIALYKAKRGREAIVFERRHKMEALLHKGVRHAQGISGMMNRRNASLIFHAVLDILEGSFLSLRDVLHKKLNQFLERVRGQIRK